MGTFNNDCGHKANNFIIRSNTNEEGLQIFWYKYATANPGSGQNWIYTIKNDAYQKKQLSKWLDNGYLEYCLEIATKTKCLYNCISNMNHIITKKLYYTCYQKIDSCNPIYYYNDHIFCSDRCRGSLMNIC